ncbi:hypothetical protein DL771_003948 [Monosporascus sp. 5C6A]|nr:hypothetical protein DL771_003948 [Monosporascus sp. 5C6A]
MNLSGIIAAILSGIVCAVSARYENTIAAKGLLGSFFGVPGLNKTYDYVIVGGGTAGLTVARRLAANLSSTVAVIEAGDWVEFSNGNLSQIPAFASYFTGNNPSLKNPYLDWYMYTTPQPIRSSSAEFLREAFVESPNLVIYKSTLAKRILFDALDARGAVVNSGGIEYTITANREVIMSAGVVNSIAVTTDGFRNRAKHVIENVGIASVVDRAGVGQNMWDNVLVGPTFALNLVSHSSLTQPPYLADAIEEFNENRTGMLTNVGGDIAAFEKVPAGMIPQSTMDSLRNTFPPDWPHLEYLVLDAYFGTGNDSSPISSDGRHAVNPIISPNWLQDPRDLDIAVAAFRRGRQLFNNY